MNNQPQQRVAVITGASSGIGKEAAKALVRAGWKVLGVGRNQARCEQARAEILEQAADSNQMVMICADLALMADAGRAAREIAANTERVDVLLNNAGGVTRELTITPEGNENTFASNHLGHFLLTRRLLPLLRRAAASSPPGTTRIINVSSAAHQACTGLDWDDLQMIDNYESGVAYCRVKLANLLFTRELARRLADEGIVAHAMHPGIVSSNFISHADEAMQSALQSKRDQWITPEAAAEALVWLATADEPGETSGEYFYDRASVATSAVAQDSVAAQRLWEESESLVARSVDSDGPCP